MTDTASSKKRALPLGLLPLALLFIALMCGGIVYDLPAVRATNAPDQFDATGAIARLTRVLGRQVPHPVDSAAQDEVRASLLHEIEALGLKPEVRESAICRPQPRGPIIDCAHVRNILFSIGPADGPAILVGAHYDSVPAGPGASDDGIGVSVSLELARLLKDQPLKRRVMFLITDGEEQGLLGAYVFGHEPLMDNVETLVNFESRGSRGPAMFFESNLPNADAVAAYASSPRPVANSVMADAYRFLPNSTDVTTLVRPGLDVINISILDGLEDYHTPQDTIASLDPRSVQHMGDMGLATLRRLATEADADAPGTMIYTDIASRAFVSAPSWAGQAALALTLLLSFVALWRAGADARWRTFAAPLVAIVFAGALGFGIAFALGLIRPGVDYWFAYPEPTRAWTALIGFLAVALAWLFLRATRNPAQGEAAGFFWFSAVGLGIAFVAPGISILYALPAVFYAAGCLIGFIWKPAQRIGGVLAAIVSALVWAPMMYLLEIAMGYEFAFVTTLSIAIVALSWLGMILRLQSDGRWSITSGVLAAGALAGIIAAAIVPDGTVARPHYVNITYFADASANRALVIAGSSERALPKELAALGFAAETLVPGDRSDVWAKPVELAPVSAPHLANVTQTEEGGRRVVRAHLAMNGAYRAVLRIPRSALPVSAGINGSSAAYADTGDQTDYVNLGCQGRACDGAEIVLTFEKPTDPADWYLMGQYMSASAPPAEPARAARPNTATPIQFGDTVFTLEKVTM